MLEPLRAARDQLGFESRQELLHAVETAPQQHVKVTCVGHAGTVIVGVEGVTLHESDAAEAAGEYVCSEEAGDAAADDNRMSKWALAHGNMVSAIMARVSDGSARAFDSARTEWCTEDVAPRDRYDYWREVATRTFIDLRIERRAQSPFWGRLRHTSLGDIGVSEIHSVDQRVHRDARGIARTPKPVYFVNVQLEGTSTLWHGRDVEQLMPGDFALVDATQPFELGLPAGFRHASFKIPHALLAPRLADRNAAVGRVVRRDTELGALISSYLRATAEHRALPQDASSLPLSEHLAGLVALAFGAAADAERGAQEDLRAARLRAARAYVDAHLAEPLTPDVVARALRVSPRYLHSLFEPTGESLMRYVIRRRLERCRADLANRVHMRRSIADVAFAWGFADLSHFGRAFRAAYGTTPREWRRRGLGST